MKAYRTYKNGEYGQWKFPDSMNLADKIGIQREIKTNMAALRVARLHWYEVENQPGKEYKELYSRLFTIHKKRGYEIHELNMGVQI